MSCDVPIYLCIIFAFYCHFFMFSLIFPQILEIEKSGSVRVLINGHGEGELWGLAPHPSLPLVATASDDGLLKVWNLQEHRMVSSLSLTRQARCVGYSPDGGYLAIGFKDGGFVVINTTDFSKVATFQHRKQEISDVKFSPGRLVPLHKLCQNSPTVNLKLCCLFLYLLHL